MLNKNPEVSFVGYSVPHPSEPKMNLRVQTVGPPATEVLHTALGNIYEISARHGSSTHERQKPQRGNRAAKLIHKVRLNWQP